MSGTPVNHRMMTDQTGIRIANELARISGGSIVEDAEAWATGKRDGVPVSSSDPTYHNNSEYYAGNALEATQHYPKISQTTGNWLNWNATTGQWDDTGVHAQGEHGVDSYVYIRYSHEYPTSDSDLKTTPDEWMGTYTGTSPTAPTSRLDYDWYKIRPDSDYLPAVTVADNGKVLRVVDGAWAVAILNSAQGVSF